MPLPVLFIAVPAVLGSAGVGLTAKAGVDQHTAKKLNDKSNSRIENAGLRLERLREECGISLQKLGEEKLYVLNNSIKKFVDLFSQLKNVDFTNSIGLEELKKFHVDKKEFDELEEMSMFALSVGEGVVAGAAGGALAAFGAYGAAGMFATASTGTAIASLSGAAATNATLAFFGGGAISAGGLGMAGGAAVLGGIVAGPALLVMGIITGAKSEKDLENAKANAEKANEICEQFENGSLQCIAIRRRTYMFYNLLAHLDCFLTPLCFEMEKIIEEEGTDYSSLRCESKKNIACAASAAVTIKAILDTPILTEEGCLTDESLKAVESANSDISRIEKIKGKE